MLLFKMIDQRLIVRAECCHAYVTSHVGWVVLSEVFEQCFSICASSTTVLSVADDLRHGERWVGKALETFPRCYRRVRESRFRKHWAGSEGLERWGRRNREDNFERCGVQTCWKEQSATRLHSLDRYNTDRNMQTRRRPRNFERSSDSIYCTQTRTDPLIRILRVIQDP
jgi:hypothetical protein